MKADKEFQDMLTEAYSDPVFIQPRKRNRIKYFRKNFQKFIDYDNSFEKEILSKCDNEKTSIQVFYPKLQETWYNSRSQYTFLKKIIGTNTPDELAERVFQIANRQRDNNQMVVGYYNDLLVEIHPYGDGRLWVHVGEAVLGGI